MLKTIKIFSLIVIFPILFSGCFLVSENLNVNNLPLYVNQDSFKWGIGFDPYPNGVHSQANLDESIAKTNNLGVKWLRIGVPDWDDANFSATTKEVQKCQQAGFSIVLGFQPNGESYENMADPYQTGFDQAYKVTSKFSNVSYFVLGNEPASGAIEEKWPGTTEESFDQEKYSKVFLWLKGASDGVAKANPYAKRIITGHWLHFGFFDMLQRDDLKYEIIGWDWHQQNPDLTKIENQGQTYNLIDIIKKFNKEVWITEAGIYKGSQNGEEIQADYLKKLASQVYNSGVFKGFFVFTLYDSLPKSAENENNLGIVNLIKDQNDSWQLSTPKEAYYVYQKIVKGGLE